MSQDLKLSKSSHSSHYTSNANSGEVKPKSKSGCGCFIFGCLGLLALILVPIVGSVVYISSLSDAEWGSKIVHIITNPSYTDDVKEAISTNKDMTPDQRKVVLQVYNKFVTDYDNLPPQQQKVINKNIFIVLKKLITDSKSFEKQPPKELEEIIKVLQLTKNIADIKTTFDVKTDKTPTKTPTTTKTPSTTKTVDDPYSFDLNTNTDNNKPKENKTSPQSEYDF